MEVDQAGGEIKEALLTLEQIKVVDLVLVMVSQQEVDIVGGETKEISEQIKSAGSVPVMVSQQEDVEVEREIKEASE